MTSGKAWLSGCPWPLHSRPPCHVLSIPGNSPQWQGPSKPSSLVPASLGPLLKCRHSEVEEGLPCGVFTCTSRMLAHGRFSSRAVGRLTLCLRSSPVFCFCSRPPPLSPLSCAGQKSLISMVSNLAVFGPMVCTFLVLVGKAFPTPPPNQKPRIRQFSSIPCRVFISLTCLPFMGGMAGQLSTH